MGARSRVTGDILRLCIMIYMYDDVNYGTVRYHQYNVHHTLYGIVRPPSPNLTWQKDSFLLLAAVRIRYGTYRNTAGLIPRPAVVGYVDLSTPCRVRLELGF